MFHQASALCCCRKVHCLQEYFDMQEDPFSAVCSEGLRNMNGSFFDETDMRSEECASSIAFWIWNVQSRVLPACRYESFVLQRQATSVVGILAALKRVFFDAEVMTWWQLFFHSWPSSDRVVLVEKTKIVCLVLATLKMRLENWVLPRQVVFAISFCSWLWISHHHTISNAKFLLQSYLFVFPTPSHRGRGWRCSLAVCCLGVLLCNLSFKSWMQLWWWSDPCLRILDNLLFYKPMLVPMKIDGKGLKARGGLADAPQATSWMSLARWCLFKPFQVVCLITNVSLTHEWDTDCQPGFTLRRGSLCCPGWPRAVHGGRAWRLQEYQRGDMAWI